MKILIYLCILVKFLVRVKFLWTEWRHKEGFDIGRKKKISQEKCKQIHQWEKKLKQSGKIWENIQWRACDHRQTGTKWRRSRGVGTLQGSVLLGHTWPLCSQGWQCATPRCWPGDLSHDTKPLRESILSSFLHHTRTQGCVPPGLQL